MGCVVVVVVGGVVVVVVEGGSVVGGTVVEGTGVVVVVVVAVVVVVVVADFTVDFPAAKLPLAFDGSLGGTVVVVAGTVVVVAAVVVVVVAGSTVVVVWVVMDTGGNFGGPGEFDTIAAVATPATTMATPTIHKPQRRPRPSGDSKTNSSCTGACGGVPPGACGWLNWASISSVSSPVNRHQLPDRYDLRLHDSGWPGVFRCNSQVRILTTPVIPAP